jgi:hypothetical protein
MDGLPPDAVCRVEWAEWQLVCDLELAHPGPHVGENAVTGKIGCWGGGTPAYVTRVLSFAETDPRAV